MKPKVPTWIIVYLGILTVATLLFTLMGYFNPSMQFGSWEAFGTAGALSLLGPMGVFLARNLATAVTTGFAVFNRTVPVLITAFLLRAVQDGMDFVHNAIEGQPVRGLVGLIPCLIELFALYTLFKLQETS